MNDREWADAMAEDILGKAASPSVGAKAVRRMLLKNMHLGRRGSYDAAANYVGMAACA